jgi:HD-GYP domain-containing protein (c-di-GMP phosphodiesterase class II)
MPTKKSPLNFLRHPWPVQTVVIALVIGSMLAIAAILVTFGWVSTKKILLETAAQSARSTGTIAEERSFRLLDPGRSTLRVLAFDPVVSASTVKERLERLPVLAEELTTNPLISAIYAGYDNGDFLLVRSLNHKNIRPKFQAPDNADFLVVNIATDATGSRSTEYRFYNAQLALVEGRPEPSFNIDPRTRPWYTAAQGTDATRVSYPYVFPAPQQVGFTMSKRASRGKAILGLDITLDDLASSLNELRPTPQSELALIDGSGAVVTYYDMDRIILSHDGDNHIRFQSVAGLGVDALNALHQSGKVDEAFSYASGGREWLGLSLPFKAIEGSNLWLLIASPTDELLGDLKHERNQVLLVALAVMLAFLPLGWWGGRSIGRSLQSITSQARRMARFDFSRPQRSPSFLREVETLTDVTDKVGVTVASFLSISQVLGSETHVETLLSQVLEKLVAATRSRGGAVYLLQPDSKAMTRVSAFGEQCGLGERFSNEAAYPVCNRPQAAGADCQQIAFEIQLRDGQLEGFLMLLYEDNVEHRTPKFWEFTNQLTGMLSVALETRQLIDAQKKLFDAIIHVLADAIDAKSPYTGGHCERVPELAIMLADKLSTDSSGPYSDFKLNDDERYAFYLAAWLHDCGKVTSQETIVDKATKLEVIYNRIHEVRMRYEVLWRDADIAYLQATRSGGDEASAAQQRDAQRQQLQEDFQFVAQCNIGSEFLSDDAAERLRAIGQTTWLRHFDDTQGLSANEMQRMAAEAGASALPATEHLLADLPHHVVHWGEHKPAVERNDPRNHYGFDMVLPALRQNMGELHNLTVRRGTLTEEDRFSINDHIVQTMIMLKQLPWPRHLARVPDIAANHHEKMDGQGYPRRLQAEALHLTDRIMAVADIFEALTAHDRPYKAPKTLSESLRIMAFMAKDQHIDAALFLYFLRSKIWLDYAQRFVQPSQTDEVDIEALAAIASRGKDKDKA